MILINDVYRFYEVKNPFGIRIMPVSNKERFQLTQQGVAVIMLMNNNEPSFVPNFLDC